ncbi:P-loop containing nucleoside triphosphate hydrolase protein, partial [Chytridium lagenaria]
RTGSGKSSLASAFFRVLDISGGKVIIDGRDISKMGLKPLRSNLQIIPQEPIIFNGTVRSNLDIHSNHTDEALWRSLELVGLKAYITEQAKKLDHPVQESGKNLSAGQRQLLCIARSILAEPKILIMDEATAALDAEGNDNVKDLMKGGLKDVTVIAVAHQIKSIAAFDKVLVLDDGKLAEFDSPKALLETEGSIFKALVEATGPAYADVVRKIANGEE